MLFFSFYRGYTQQMSGSFRQDITTLLDLQAELIQ